MAFYEEQNEDELDPNNQAGGVQTGPQSSTIATNAASSTGSQPGTPQSGSNFVGIKQYIDANKPQAAKLGDQAANVINQSANQARQDVGAFTQEADQKIKPTQSLDQGVVGKLQNNAEALTGDERNTIKQTASAKYTGPKDETQLGAYNQAAKSTQAAAGNINNSGTESGRMNLISQINSKPRTQGMNVFDNTLLQAGGGREKLAQAAQTNQDVKGGLDAATQAVRNKIGRADDPSTPDVDESAGAIGQTNKAQADAYQKIQNAMNSWQSNFTPRVQQARDNIYGLNQRVVDDFGNDPYNLTQETLGLYNMKDGDDTFGADLASFFRQGDINTVLPETVASQEDFARYAALADLAGVSPTLLNPQNAGMAGTAKLASVDQEGLRNAIESGKSAYSAKIKEMEAARDSAYNRAQGILAEAADLGFDGKQTPQYQELMRQFQDHNTALSEYAIQGRKKVNPGTQESSPKYTMPISGPKIK